MNATPRDYVLPAISRHGSRIAVRTHDRTWTYAEIHDSAMTLANMFHKLGVRQGDPVAILLENSAEFLIAHLAIIQAGAAMVPINMMLSAADIGYILSDSQPAAIITAHENLPTVNELTGAADPVILTVADDGRWNDVRSGEKVTFPPESQPEGIDWEPLDPSETALIVYTGGTTGKPKGVVHKHGGYFTNIVSHVLEAEIHADDKMLLSSPLPHSAGFLALTGLIQGAEIFIEKKFDLSVLMDRIEKERVSYLFMVPTMIYRLLDAINARDSFDSSSLRTIFYGASPITEDRLKQGLEMLGDVFIQLYGQSEAPNFITKLRRDDHTDSSRPEKIRSCGQSVFFTKIKTVKPDGTKCNPYEVGEVVARAPYVLDHYHNKPEATQEALVDGWLHTGDLGYLDPEGYLYLVDRKKDMIITGGLNVYATEVENALTALEAVTAAAVIGKPHPDWGESVTAYVVPSSDSVTEDEIIDALRETLTAYKRPKEVIFLDSLPETAVGKINKKALRDDSASTQESSGR